ncbi:sensor histidine kinase [Methylomicrobium sp. RS1]|uniref:sensor histidine kinase n=1 Tax=Candidatus Methylomicrobium oryzae TaxID=2802053 RepID=UPI00192484BD|nr:HAMP domain-containing sensor histidine kinase [Methylomicrobium sp. RS1]MBL1263846.1 HAMP domain-containing histidine kinase [Methylomicrobium sp. RS1]
MQFLNSPVQHRVLAFLLLMSLTLAMFVGMIWRNLHHFNTVFSHVNYSHSVQHASVALQKALIDYLTKVTPLGQHERLLPMIEALSGTVEELNTLFTESGFLAESSAGNMGIVKAILDEWRQPGGTDKQERLISALNLLSDTLDNELGQREKLLGEISEDTQTELDLAAVTFIVIVVVAFGFFYRRILHPLHDLRLLLQRLTEGNFTRITTDHLDPLLLPVFNSYNEMVSHLAELEEAKRLYAQSLQREVRLATQALLEQQASLARAERLAAVGEVAAELAHEIRNPLAGIQIAFSNLRREIDNPGQYARMDLIGGELKRLGHLLNDLLNQSRHVPEEADDIDVAMLIRDLAALTRYQIAESIRLEVVALPLLTAHLPAGGLRQALLNLILNAADALEGRSGMIRVTAAQDAEGFRIEVADDGPGFSPELLEQGIRPFRTTRQRGTGLGLTMVQRYVKETGGCISLKNQIPHGACVSLCWPAIAEEAHR